ncbi:MAG: hypothetical protein ABIP20_07905, partial [Chthoniobacteraceae bacterium]
YPSYALAIGGTSATSVDVRNNALYNTQTSTSTGKSYAIGLAYSTYATLTSNYNDLVVSGTSSVLGAVGSLSAGTAQTTLAIWQATTLKDANSVSADPLFTSASDLHVTALASPVSNAGTPLAGVLVDFDGGTRSAATPDIGADEFGASNLPTVTTPTQTAITSTSATLGGNVTDDGGTAITERGIVYSITTVNGDPLINGTGVTKFPNPGTTGSFTVNAGGLNANSGYSFKAYAVNVNGTIYTSPVSTFSTLTALNNWRLTWFGTTSNTGNAADDADPYHTGVPNLAVFALLGPAQNPELVAAIMLPQARIIGTDYVITFTQPAGVSGVIYGAEWKADLSTGSWTSITESGSGSMHTFSVPIDSNENMFIRLRVSTP